MSDIKSSNPSNANIIYNLIILFAVIITLAWIILYTISFSIVQDDDLETDPLKCFIGALIIAFICIIFVGIFQVCKFKTN